MMMTAMTLTLGLKRRGCNAHSPHRLRPRASSDQRARLALARLAVQALPTMPTA